ncbi:MAG: nuclear transport factor 2 family protein [Chloroflexi bacterium]|nr:nuclear transport factor 2 family protein [Chloroflexota bacterium]
MSHHDSHLAGSVGNRAAVERMFAAYVTGNWEIVIADEADDFVQEWPQSHERLTGKGACLAVYRNYPGGSPTVRVKRMSGEGDHWTVETEMHYGEQLVRGIHLLEFRDGKIVHETDYFADPFDPPAWRSQWVSVEA